MRAIIRSILGSGAGGLNLLLIGHPVSRPELFKTSRERICHCRRVHCHALMALHGSELDQQLEYLEAKRIDLFSSIA